MKKNIFIQVILLLVVALVIASSTSCSIEKWNVAELLNRGYSVEYPMSWGYHLEAEGSYNSCIVFNDKDDVIEIRMYINRANYYDIRTGLLRHDEWVKKMIADGIVLENGIRTTIFREETNSQVSLMYLCKVSEDRTLTLESSVNNEIEDTITEICERMISTFIIEN